MKRSRATVLGAAVGMMFGAGAVRGQSIYSPWPTDALDNPNFFPIGVWYQTPNPSYNNEISGYKAIGVNTFVYLAPSTSSTVLTDISNAGMYAIMSYSASLVSNKTIIAWYSSPDEPDNAQPNGSGGYGDPVNPATQVAEYNTIKSEDSTRPVYEGFGQGVAWNYPGRGSQTGHNQDYPYSTSYVWTNGQTYTQGYLDSTDIGAFDIYPENSTYSQVAGKTSIVGTGVANLVKWSKPGNPVWNTIETTQITSGQGSAPTTAEVKAEAWISLVNGSDGIIYFADTITPFVEDALLQSPTMSAAVTAINSQVESLAPELNSATVSAGTIVTGHSSDVNVEFMTKEVSGNEYLFSTTAQNSSTDPALFYDTATPHLNATVTVIGENRTIAMINGAFVDNFTSNDVHLYEIPGVSGFTPQLSAAAPLNGDCNLDGKVDSTDLGIFLSNWGKTGAGWEQGDFNGDGTVDSTNLGLLLANWQDTAALGTLQLDQIESLTGDSVVANADGTGFTLVSVPEPATAGLLAVGLLGLFRRRARRAE